MFDVSQSMTSEQKREFGKIITYKNIRSGMTLLIAISLIETFVLVFALITLDRTERLSYAYVWCYVFLLTLSVGCYFAAYLLNRRKKASTLVYKTIVLTYVIGILLWSIVISLLDRSQGLSAIVVLTILMGVAGFVYLRPVEIFAIEVGAFLVYYITAVVLKYEPLSFSRTFNLVVFMLFVVFIALFRYFDKVRSFLQQHEIVTKNDELTVANEKLRRANNKLDTISKTDALTGLKNRLSLNERIDMEYARSLDDGTTLSMAIIDLDDFKSVNDRYGHKVGDDCLLEFAAVMRATLPLELYRFGGEEFVTLMPDATAKEIRECLETARKSVEKTKFTEHEIDLTVSIGIFAARAVDEDKIMFMVKADRALYRCKQSGKNSVAVYEDRA